MSDQEVTQHIRIRGARQHNLKNVDLDIPVGELTVITGPSGSGKSSLAFHTLYAEGQRRYVETFSPYVRQFFDRMDKPEVDKIEGIPPAIAIEQKNTIRTTRSTVGTLTEINDYLKLIYPRLATGHHPDTGAEVRPDTPTSILAHCLEHFVDEQVLILFPISVPQDTSPDDLFPFLNAQGYLRVFLNGEVARTDSPSSLDKLPTEIFVIQDRVNVSTRNKSRLTEAFEQALHLGKGRCQVQQTAGDTSASFSTSWHPLREPTPSLFSFNSPLGACDNCRGFGRVIGIDLDRAIPNHRLSLAEGTIKPFEGERGAECRKDLMSHLESMDIDPYTPWCDLTSDQQQWIKYGERRTGSPLSSLEQSEALWQSGQWYGIQGFFDWLETKAYKMHVRVFLSRYRAYTTCPECRGNRLQPDALNFRLLSKTLPELWHIPLDQLLFFFEGVASAHAPLDKTTEIVLHEITSRLQYLVAVGLGYLTLDRPARTLSGGEIARVNLTTCLGSALTHTLFVLDEPTVGLHHRDIDRLTSVMKSLRDKGNTIVVVEHDEAVMREADQLIDVGPHAGEGGGEIVFQGRFSARLKSQLNRHPASQTLPFLLGKETIPAPEKIRQPKAHLQIRNASCHNIHDLSVDLPLGVFTCLTGVSGSGKSTLAHPIIHNNLARHFGIPLEEEPAPAEIRGLDELNGVKLIDQSPLSRTPRSTPAVLLGAYEHIRQLFAMTPAARAESLTPGYFSFNSGHGRCQRCAGNGFEKVEMQFLSDLFLTCPECNGTRFTLAAQEFHYHGKNITEILRFTATEALAFLENVQAENSREKLLLGKARFALQPLVDTGLGYLRLGQPLNTLSGGEAQRLKLCQLLVDRSGSINTLLILDEPTTGLHFVDIQKLLTIFHRLTDAGYSLLVIEHQTDVIRNADHIIEIGPEAGDHGGQIIFEGSPVALTKANTHTGAALSPQKKPKKKAAKRATKSSKSEIALTRVRHHNLKDLTTTIPHHEFVVISGLSGSGKSTLAFDVLFSEGQRRFLDSMSPYARQFASQLEKPDLDQITGLPPTVAIEQRISRGGGKSTVGTVTEIYHFLRLLYAKVGIQHCPQSGQPVVSQTPEVIGQQLGKVLKKHRKLRLLSPVLRGRKGFHKEYADAAAKAGFEEMFIDGELIRTEDFRPLARHKAHDIDFVVATLNHRQVKKDITTALARALQVGRGTFRTLSDSDDLQTFSTARVSPVTGESFEALDPHHFSFNSPRGWCSTCRGYGYITREKFDTRSYNSEAEAEIQQERSLSEPDEKEDCPDCHGARLREASCHVLISKTSLPDLCQLTVKDAIAQVKSFKFTGRDREITRDIVPEILQRLNFLAHVGLGYLQLDRAATTLSGGESQRIRLAAQLGSNLQGVLYILDEPTIGLHPRDNAALLTTLKALKDKGNSLVLVEHDEDTIRAATHLIDLGPGAGVEGGQIVYQGKTTKTALKNGSSPTLTALKTPLTHPARGKRRPLPKPRARSGWLRLKDCTLNNLKTIDAQFPLGCLTVLTGPSGSGKSSLMRGCLSEAASGNESDAFASATGFDVIKHTFEVDQSPIGKTSRSCPATYVKLFDHIRALFAQLPESRMRGYTASRFSFNNKEGQCPECKGNGRIRLEMDFLPTTWIDCESCHGDRYNPATLEVFYNGQNIGDILRMNIKTAAQFFEAHPKLQKPLQLLADTGLGYLTLGQASPTLSGGEAQRLKLVTQFIKGRPDVTKIRPGAKNLYLIEEPTIGLHQQDVARLIDVLHRLVDEGHTVVVIEHHMDLAAEADYLIDLGPEAGPSGGQIVVQGPPEKIAQDKKSITAPFIKAALTDPS